MKLHLPKNLTVALIAAISAVCFTLPQTFAEETPLTLTIPSNGQIISGNSSLNWTGSTSAGLSSWELAFELDPGTSSDQSIFNLNAGGVAYTGYHLYLQDTSTLILRDNSNNNLATVSLNGQTPITLSFVKNVDEYGVSRIAGTFYLSANGGTIQEVSVVQRDNGIYNTTFHPGSGSGSGDTRFWTNSGNQKIYNIALTLLDNNIVPASEPPTYPDYNMIVVTRADQLGQYTSANDITFAIAADITNSSYRMTGIRQYWGDQELQTHVLTFTGLESSDPGGALKIGEFTAVFFKEFLFSGNHSSDNGGAIFANKPITMSGNGRVAFSENTSSYAGGAIYGQTSSTITLSNNENVTFSGNTASNGGAIESYGAFTLSDNESVTFSGNTAFHGGSIDSLGEFTLSNNGSVTFSGNTAEGGSAICAMDSGSVVTLSDNGIVTFSGNSAGSGAILAGYSATITLSNNESVTFSGNSAAGGGAICGGISGSSGTISLTGNGSVTFSENSASSSGGAIFGGGSGTISLTGNGSVTFSGNSASSYGGAFFAESSSTITLSNNESVMFSGNSASSYGGAIHGGEAGTISLTGNGSVTFSGNSTSSYGGAIFAESSSTITLNNNESVTFSGNYASYYGGAIGAESSSPITLSNNSSVTFSGNSAGYGGAIYGSCSTITFSGNGHVEFRGNYEISGSGNSATYRLRSVYGYSSSINLSAGAGQDIVFYDTLYAGSASTVSFNAKYVDKHGVEQEATGDIVFNGKYAAEDLKALKADHTQEELTNSLTTEVQTTTNLYGGTLSIEDGAIYKGWGINVAEDSYATLRLSNGSLEHDEYDITLATSATLEASGVDRITAAMLAMNDGSSMKLAAGATLDVDGTIAFTASQETTWSVEGGAEITADKMSGNGSTISSLNNVNVDIIDNYTIEDMSISGSVIDISEGTTLYVKHVNIEADARITDEAAWLDMVDTHGWLDNSNTEAAAPVMSLGDTLFYRAGDDAWVRLNHDVSYVALTSELFSNVTLTGSDLWLDLTGLADTIGNAQAFSMAFKDALYDANGLRVVATVDGEHYLDGYYTTKQEGTTTTLYFSSQIPEPTTSTLSLLAFAALAARRKRTR